MGDLEHEILGDRDPRISETFYFFEAMTTLASGRTVGRKIGVVQEILLRKYLEADGELRRRMYLEQMLEGRSGASHKVEFSWYPISERVAKVGDEIVEGITVAATVEDDESVRIAGPWDSRKVKLVAGMPTPRTGPLHEYLKETNLDLRVTGVEGGQAFIDVVDRSTLLASLESKRVGAQRFSGSEKLGSGIQTIEKAKQASLVAIDLDIRHNANVKPLQDPAAPKQLISLVALGNGVHWTAKDKAVLGTYVDYTFLVRDAGIIRYANYVKEIVGEEDFLARFMDYFVGMTKQPADDFEVTDDDFEIVVPTEEDRPLRTILREHIDRTNPA